MIVTGRAALLGLVMGCLAGPAQGQENGASQDPVVGNWRTKAGAVIQIQRCDDSLCGYVVSLKEPYGKEGNPRRDEENPDPAKRSEPICESQILRGDFDRDGPGRWEGGTIYNPEDGSTYKANLTVREDGKLKVRGYMGFSALGRTQIWTRAPDYERCPMKAKA